MEKIGIDALSFLIKENKDRRVLITFHSIGDTDSVTSAVSLSKYFANARVATPDIITANASRILKRMGFESLSIGNNFDPDAELIVLTDVNNFEDCGEFRFQLEGFRGKTIIIDHHSPKEIQKENVFVFNDESYNSAASIVFALLKKLDQRLDEKTAMLLLAGIISDSADLRNSTPSTFMQIGELLGIARTEYPEVLEKMEHVADAAARARTMTDITKAKVDLVEGLLYVHGKAHAHANIAADAAINIGADVALFTAEDAKEVSFSARLRAPLDRRLGIHLGMIMKSLAGVINGNGGGHPCAAGAYGQLSTNADEFEKRFLEEIAKRARGKAKVA